MSCDVETHPGVCWDMLYKGRAKIFSGDIVTVIVRYNDLDVLEASIR